MSILHTRTEWRLWADWCAATDVAPLDAAAADIARFLAVTEGNAATRKRRARVIVAAHQEVGNPLSTPQEGSQPPLWPSDGQLLALADALGALPTRGWPNGLRARRDGWILVLAAAGFTRQHIRTMTATDVATGPLQVADTPIDTGDSPHCCPACAVTRWLHTVTVYQLWGRRSARIHLADQLSVTPTQAHFCGEPLPDGWTQIRQLTPAIDRHGWLEDRTPMSARAVTAVVNGRRDPSSTNGGLANDPPPAAHVDERFAGMDLDELSQMLTDMAEETGGRVDWLTSTIEQDVHGSG